MFAPLSSRGPIVVGLGYFRSHVEVALTSRRGRVEVMIMSRKSQTFSCILGFNCEGCSCSVPIALLLELPGIAECLKTNECLVSIKRTSNLGQPLHASQDSGIMVIACLCNECISPRGS